MSRLSAPSINAISRLLLAGLVSVSILQTPIPVAHIHSGIESTEDLSEHLVRHHQQDRVPGDEIHWHLVLPGETGDESDSSPVERSIPLALSCAGGSFLSANFGRAEIEWLPPLLRDFHTLTTIGDMPARRPLPPRCSLTSSKRTCALLCVIRC